MDRDLNKAVPSVPSMSRNKHSLGISSGSLHDMARLEEINSKSEGFIWSVSTLLGLLDFKLSQDGGSTEIKNNNRHRPTQRDCSHVYVVAQCVECRMISLDHAESTDAAY